MPKISVIIPVYNVEKFLSKCIESVLSQTFKDFELILVDDGSPDNSPRICDEYEKKDARIKVIHKQNGGVSSARNAGLNIAQGEYITFVDSDDWIDSTMYEEMMKTTEISPCDLIICGIKKQNKFGEYEILQYNDQQENKYYLSKNEVLELFCCLREDKKNAIELHAPVNKLFKREILNLYENSIRFNENMIAYEDGLFCTNFFDAANSVCIVNKSFYNYFYNENSACNTKISLEKLKKINLDRRNLKLQTYHLFKKNNLPIERLKKYFLFADICDEFFFNTPNDELKAFANKLASPSFLLKNFCIHTKDVLKIILSKMKLLKTFRKLKILNDGWREN